MPEGIILNMSYFLHFMVKVVADNAFIVLFLASLQLGHIVVLVKYFKSLYSLETQDGSANFLNSTKKTYFPLYITNTSSTSWFKEWGQWT